MQNREKRSLAIRQLRSACADFGAAHKPQTVTSDVLELFLERTAEIDAPWNNKLISFAINFQDDLGWDEVCKIYEYMLTNEPGEEHHGTYAVWIGVGFKLMTDVDELKLADRIHVAENLEKVIQRAGTVGMELAHVWGNYYYDHPLRDEQIEYLQNAAKWLKIAVEQKREDDELDSDTLCRLANSYFQLGEMEQAAKYYAEINLDQLDQQGEISQESVHSRFAQCKQALD